MKRILRICVIAAVIAALGILLYFGVIQSSAEKIPPYTGDFIVVLNDNYPDFTVKDISSETFVSYSSLDGLGRAGAASGCLDASLMPAEARGSIAEIIPSGWQSDSGIYNRAHLIAYQLAGNNTSENLITGTSFLNVEGMLPFENRVAMYVKNTGNHVLYRVTPLYEKKNLIASAVQMEAFSVEDNGRGICFNVLIYNIQPGYTIDYATGAVSAIESNEPELIQLDSALLEEITSAEDFPEVRSTVSDHEDAAITYVLNSNTMRFHYPYCNSVLEMKEENRVDFYGTREEAIAQGYKPCGACNP